MLLLSCHPLQTLEGLQNISQGIFSQMECSFTYQCFLITLPHFFYKFTRPPVEKLPSAAAYLANLYQEMLKFCLLGGEVNSRDFEKSRWQRRCGKLKRTEKFYWKQEGAGSPNRGEQLQYPKAKCLALSVEKYKILCDRTTILALPKRMSPILAESTCAYFHSVNHGAPSQTAPLAPKMKQQNFNHSMLTQKIMTFTKCFKLLLVAVEFISNSVPKVTRVEPYTSKNLNFNTHRINNHLDLQCWVGILSVRMSVDCCEEKQHNTVSLRKC